MENERKVEITDVQGNLRSFKCFIYPQRKVLCTYRLWFISEHNETKSHIFVCLLWFHSPWSKCRRGCTCLMRGSCSRVYRVQWKIQSTPTSSNTNVFAVSMLQCDLLNVNQTQGPRPWRRRQWIARRCVNGQTLAPPPSAYVVEVERGGTWQALQAAPTQRTWQVIYDRVSLLSGLLGSRWERATWHTRWNAF